MDEYTVLYYAQKAVSEGSRHAEKAWMYNQYCQIVRYQQLKFVLTEGFEAVITIIWDPPTAKFVGNPSSTFHRNANQFGSSSCTAAIASYHTPPSAKLARTSSATKSQSRPQPMLKRSGSSTSSKSKSKMPLIDTTSMDQLDEIEVIEFDELLDEIAGDVAFDVDNDPELTDYHQHSAVTKSNSSSSRSPPSQHSPPRSSSHGVEVSVSHTLWNELCRRFYGQLQFAQSREELAYTVQQLIMQYHHDRVAVQRIGDINQWCVWVDAARRYVYITESELSMASLLDVFEVDQFRQQYAHCLLQLKQKKYSMSSSAMASNVKAHQPPQPQPQQAPSSQLNQLNLAKYSQLQHKLVMNNYSGRSIVSNTTQSSLSRRSLVLDATTSNHGQHGGEEMKEQPEGKHKKHEYHTIYLKPIIERMKAIAFSSEEASTAIDSECIIEIVDNSIKYGSKRQISKRTFEFKWNSYTCIMSKSLKTILDVTLSTDAEIITVHPDVVSIISKKCPQLDYFTIQKLAKQAKATRACTTKKNDYRQQFIYDCCGCRIVFASNHTTIVEMQCNDPSAIQLN